MTLDEALNILHGEQVDVDSSVFDGQAQPTGVYLECSVRFPRNKKGIGGWADIIGETIYVQPTGDGAFGRYVPISLVRRKAQA